MAGWSTGTSSCLGETVYGRVASFADGISRGTFESLPKIEVNATAQRGQDMPEQPARRSPRRRRPPCEATAPLICVYMSILLQSRLADELKYLLWT